MTSTSPLRPISRRVVYAMTALGLVLSACGDPVTSDTSPVAASATTPASGGPRVIRLPGTAGGAVESAPAAVSDGAPSVAADSKLAASYWAAMNYVWSGTTGDLSTPAGSWFLPAGTSPTDAQLAALAGAFGLPGEFVRLPAEQGGGWQIGSADGTGAGLNISTDGMLSWYFNPDPSVWNRPVETCAVAPVEPAVEPAVAPAVEPAVEPAGEVLVGGDAAVSNPIGEVCATPEPPAGVPSAEEAEAKATAFFAALGIDLAGYDIDVYGDEWGRTVTAYRLLDGKRSPLATSVGYGADGAIVWANGALGEPQRGDDYPRIGVEAGVDRLNEQSGGWRGGIEPMPLPAEIANDAVTNDAVTDDAVTDDAVTEEAGREDSTGDAVVGDPGSGVEVPLGADSGVSSPAPGAPDLAIDPMICEDWVQTATSTDDGVAVAAPADAAAGDAAVAVEAVPVVEPFGPNCGVPSEPITVELTGVREDLTMIWDAEGTVWLLPAYTFTSADGGEYQVTAIDDSFLQYDAVIDPAVSGPAEGTDVGVAPPAGVDGSQPALVEPPAVGGETITELPEGPSLEAATAALVGLAEAEALAAAAANGWTMRVTELDGQMMAVTMDFRPQRVNVAVASGVVTKVFSNG